MKYNETYIHTRDIDWFCIINNQYIHVASAGGQIPSQINERDTLRKIQHQVSEAEYIYSDDEILINTAFLRQKFDNVEKIEDYIKSFKDMAKKGFSSFDRTNLCDLNDNKYHMVCQPRKPGKCVLEGNDLVASYNIGIEKMLEITSEIDFIKLFLDLGE